jgi:hypothetical protein
MKICLMKNLVLNKRDKILVLTTNKYKTKSLIRNIKIGILSMMISWNWNLKKLILKRSQDIKIYQAKINYNLSSNFLYLIWKFYILNLKMIFLKIDNKLIKEDFMNKIWKEIWMLRILWLVIWELGQRIYLYRKNSKNKSKIFSVKLKWDAI